MVNILSRMERVVRERMSIQDTESITPQQLINIRPVIASIKEFFRLCVNSANGFAWSMNCDN
jgi:DNA-directed RNA polymerase beta subunit